jgi:hypothetical protein
MATKPTLGDIAATILDPMLSDNYLLNIPDIPGNDGGAAQALRMQCTSAAKPGATLNAVEVQVFGHTLEFAANKTFSHDMSVEYVENRTGKITDTLERWADLIRDTETQTGEYKAGYARSGYFTIFDNKGKTVREYEIHGMWPSAVPDLSFNGQSSSIITLSVSFKFDHYTLRNRGA